MFNFIIGVLWYGLGMAVAYQGDCSMADFVSCFIMGYLYFNKED